MDKATQILLKSFGDAIAQAVESIPEEQKVHITNKTLMQRNTLYGISDNKVRPFYTSFIEVETDENNNAVVYFNEDHFESTEAHKFPAKDTFLTAQEAYNELLKRLEINDPIPPHLSR